MAPRPLNKVPSKRRASRYSPYSRRLPVAQWGRRARHFKLQRAELDAAKALKAETSLAWLASQEVRQPLGKVPI